MKKAEEGKDIARTVMVSDHAVQVLFRAHSIHIDNDKSLKRLLEAGVNDIDTLVLRIKQIFTTIYARDLDIDPDSLAVEIWGHVYCERLADLLADKIPLTLLDKITDRVIAYCEVIDCGEASYDGNRVFWNMLAPFKEAIVGRLPDKDK